MFIRLKPGFKVERKEERHKQKLGLSSDYLSDQDRAKYELQTLGNGFCDQENQLLDGNYLYVRTLDGKVYLAKSYQIRHHSFLSNGKKVTSAGHFIFKNGKLILASNESGHYTPTNSDMLEDMKYYLELSKNEDLIYEDHSSVPAQGLILQYKATEFISNSADTSELKLLMMINDRQRDPFVRSAFGRQLITNADRESQQASMANLQGNKYKDACFLDDETDEDEQLEFDADIVSEEETEVAKTLDSSAGKKSVYLNDMLIFNFKNADEKNAENAVKHTYSDEINYNDEFNYNNVL